MVFSYNVLNLPRAVVTETSGSLTYTYLSDGTNTALQFRNRDYYGGTLSAVGVLPYFGDLAKVGRIGRNVRKNLVRMTGMNPKGMEAHHLLPKAFEEPLGRKGINVHDPKYGRWVNHSKHNKTAQRYNQDFEQFLKSNESVSEKDIIDFAESLMRKYDLY